MKKVFFATLVQMIAEYKTPELLTLLKENPLGKEDEATLTKMCKRCDGYKYATLLRIWRSVDIIKRGNHQEIMEGVLEKLKGCLPDAVVLHLLERGNTEEIMKMISNRQMADWLENMLIDRGNGEEIKTYIASYPLSDSALLKLIERRQTEEISAYMERYRLPEEAWQKISACGLQPFFEYGDKVSVLSKNDSSSGGDISENYF